MEPTSSSKTSSAVSSILPAGCELIAPDPVGIATLRPGEITFCVMARAETSEPGRRISASIGLARPKDPTIYGYISEHHGFGMTESESGEYAEDLAATMLASTLGIEFDPDAAWNERKKVYETSGLIIDSLSLTAAAEGAADGSWTCAVAAAVFRFEKPEACRSHERAPNLCHPAYVPWHRPPRATVRPPLCIAGIPLDIGTTNRSGARFGPGAVRQAEPDAR